MRIRAGKPSLEFTRKINSVPVAGVEFARAALEYPIVFAGPSEDKMLPTVLLGLRPQENLFLDAQGNWNGIYIPAFIRRYPFVLAEQPGKSDFTVCIDSAFSGLVDSSTKLEEGDQPLFDGEGKETPLLQGALKFLSEYQGYMARTQLFVKRLNELKLLRTQTLQVMVQGEEKMAVNGFSIVDENKLRELPDSVLGELNREGFLSWAYAHLVSLGNAQQLHLKIAGIK